MYYLKIAVLIFFASAVSAQSVVGDAIDEAIASGEQYGKQYLGNHYNLALVELNGDPSVVLPSLRVYFITNQGVGERQIAIDLFRQSNLSIENIIDHILVDIDYSDASDMEASSLIALQAIPVIDSGPDYSVYSAFLTGDDTLPEEQAIIKWLISQDAFKSLDSIAARLLVPIQQIEEYRSIILHLRNIEDSAWREYRTFIDDGTLTNAAEVSLDALLLSQHWWVRLAAVELLGNYPYTQTPVRLQQVCSDTNQNVSMRAQQLGLCN